MRGALPWPPIVLAAVAWFASACSSDAPRGQVESHAAPGASTEAPRAAAAAASTPSPSSSLRASAAASPAPPAPRATRGLWIWELERNGPGAERAAELAARWGVHRVFLKSGNGDSRGRWTRNFSAANRAPFLRRGIELWAFAYVYGEGVADADGRTWGTVDEQVDAISDATVHDGVRGLVVDAEVELVDRPDDARRLCSGFRTRLGPDRRLAYTSFGWLQRWSRFPFEAFDRGCGDAFLPQVYSAHGWPGGTEGSLGRLREGVAARGLRAPVWPVQTNMPNPEVDALEGFFRRAGPDASVFFLHAEDTEQTRRLAQLDWRTAW